ncbi:MAG: hypothetical protein ACRDK3_10920 [Actinomycetota bacterium]
MNEVFCPDCRFKQPSEHRYCFRCGRSLPRHLAEATPSKLARFFAGVKIDEGDPENAYLRVSCYRKQQTFESPEGSVVIPGSHVRFSIWVNDEAKCVLSVPETEARDLGRFLEEGMRRLGDTMVGPSSQEARSTGNN